MKKLIAALVLLMSISIFQGCNSDAKVASQNLSKDAEMFRINRRVVFFNGITDTYILSVEGFCSLEDNGKQLKVTCKIGNNYKKHYLGLSDNVSYFAEQIESANVSVDHYKVIFKPQAIIPDVELATSK